MLFNSYSHNKHTISWLRNRNNNVHFRKTYNYVDYTYFVQNHRAVQVNLDFKIIIVLPVIDIVAKIQIRRVPNHICNEKLFINKNRQESRPYVHNQCASAKHASGRFIQICKLDTFDRPAFRSRISALGAKGLPKCSIFAPIGNDNSSKTKRNNFIADMQL